MGSTLESDVVFVPLWEVIVPENLDPDVSFNSVNEAYGLIEIKVCEWVFMDGYSPVCLDVPHRNCNIAE